MGSELEASPWVLRLALQYTEVPSGCVCAACWGLADPSMPMTPSSSFPPMTEDTQLSYLWILLQSSWMPGWAPGAAGDEEGIS